jgi:hypothetical protein
LFRRHHHAEGTPAQPAVDWRRAEGTILVWAPSPAYRTKVRLTVGAKFSDGEKVEFVQDIMDIVLPPEGDFAARMAAMAQPPIGISLSVGDKIPVLYDAADRQRMVIDEQTLHERAISAHNEAEAAKRAQADALLDASDPVVEDRLD